MSDTTSSVFGPRVSGSAVDFASDIRIAPAARLSPAQLEAARKVLQHIRPAGGPVTAGAPTPGTSSAAAPDAR